MNAADSAKSGNKHSRFWKVTLALLLLALLIGLASRPRPTEVPDDMARWLDPDWSLTFDQFRQKMPETESERRYRRCGRLIPGESLVYETKIGGLPALLNYSFEPDEMLRSWDLTVEMPDATSLNDSEVAMRGGHNKVRSGQAVQPLHNPEREAERAAVRRLAADMAGFLDQKLQAPVQVYHQTSDAEEQEIILSPWAFWLDSYHLLWEDDELLVHLRYVEHDLDDISGSNPRPRRLQIIAQHKPRLNKRPREKGELSFADERRIVFFEDIYLPHRFSQTEGPPNSSLGEFQAALNKRAEEAVQLAASRPDPAAEWIRWLAPDWSRTKDQIRQEFGRPDLEYHQRKPQKSGQTEKPLLSLLAYQPELVSKPGLLKYVFRPDKTLARAAVEWDLGGWGEPEDINRAKLLNLMGTAERLAGWKARPVVEVWENFSGTIHPSDMYRWNGFYRLTWMGKQTRARVFYHVAYYQRPGQAPDIHLQYLELETVPADQPDAPSARFPGLETIKFERELFQREMGEGTGSLNLPPDKNLKRRNYQTDFLKFLAELDDPCYFGRQAWNKLPSESKSHNSRKSATWPFPCPPQKEVEWLNIP